jgi:ABC-type uncharacterized transport system ATPase subunit
MAGTFLSPDKITRHCEKLMTDFDIRPADPNLKSSLFSGGNQQKIVGGKRDICASKYSAGRPAD